VSYCIPPNNYEALRFAGYSACIMQLISSLSWAKLLMNALFECHNDFAIE
jgi:hypothetical protein